MATNLNSVFCCLRAEARAMRAGGAGGAIVNMASINAVGPGFIQTGLVERNWPRSSPSWPATGRRS
jgi:NAD(P)-dependent dehydrogenase (short-subunit alcohol dehydrogenase family)